MSELSLAQSATPPRWLFMTPVERQLDAFGELARLMDVPLEHALWEVPPHVAAEFLGDRDLWAHAEQVLAPRPYDELFRCLDRFWERWAETGRYKRMVVGVSPNGTFGLMVMGPHWCSLRLQGRGRVRVVSDRDNGQITAADWDDWMRDVARLEEDVNSHLEVQRHTAWKLSHQGPKVWRV